MIQVIHRALDILELLAKEPQIPKTLGEISGGLNLNAGTCANIIKTLTARHYIEKLDKQKGYMLGALAYKLTGENAYKKHLVDAAKDELEKLTVKINESTVMGVLNGDTRVAVVVVEGSNNLTVQSNLIKKAYDTATGRLLIAHLANIELEKFIGKYGLPGQAYWKEVKSKKRLLEELGAIRSKKFSYHVTDSQIIGIGVPVYEGATVVASVGVYMPLSRYKNWKQADLLKLLNGTAAAVGSKLS